MARPVEKALIAVVLAGIGVVAILLWQAQRSPESTETTAPIPDVATEATLTRTPAAEPAPSTSPSRTPHQRFRRRLARHRRHRGRAPAGRFHLHQSLRAERAGVHVAADHYRAAAHREPPGDHGVRFDDRGFYGRSAHNGRSFDYHRPADGLAFDHGPAATSSATTRAPAASSSTTAQPAPSPSTTIAPTTSSSTTVAPATSPPTTLAETSQRCESVEEVWKWDGHPVEDPCTLAEVKRVMRWAWLGTDEQRRSAIRNSHLLDEVFAALEEVGQKLGAGVFHSETRGEWDIGSGTSDGMAVRTSTGP